MKKSEKAQLGSKRGQFLIIGVIVGLSVTITAFEWKTYGETDTIDCNLISRFDPDEIIPPTVHEEPKPPKPKPKIAPIIIEATEDEIIDEMEFVIDPIDIDNLNSDDYIEPPKEEEAPDFMLFPEVKPEFEGGQMAFMKYVAKQIKYPSQARRMGIEGRVFVEFIIDKDGKLTQIKTIKGIGAGCDEEAVRVLKNAPAWKPGKQRGKPVKVKMVLPINFTLG